MLKTIKTVVSIVSATLSPGFAYGQTTSATNSNSQPKVVTIGVAAPLSGPIAHLGKAISRGVELAIEQANSDPATPERPKLRFEIEEQDDGADSNRAVAVATALADRGVTAVVGHLNSGLSIPASRVYASRGIAMVTPASSNPALTDQGLSNVFRVVARDDMQPSALLAAAREEGIKRIAILAERSVYGGIIGRAAVDQSELSFVQVVLTETGLTPDTIASRAIGERLSNLQLDAILLIGTSKFLSGILKASTEAGAKPMRILASDHACSDDVLTLQIQPHRILCASPDPDETLIDERFAQAYARKYGDKPHPYAATAYDAAKLIVQAARTAANVTPADVALRLRLASYTGATGPISFDRRGDRVGAAVLLSEIVDGKFKLKYLSQSGKLNRVKSADK